MTHRGPFQPLLFCDSVIPWFCLSADLAGGQHLPWEAAAERSPRMTAPEGAWAAQPPQPPRQDPLQNFASEPPSSAVPARVAEAQLFCGASEPFVRRVLGRTWAVTHRLSYCHSITDFSFILEWTRHIACGKKYWCKLQNVSIQHNEQCLLRRWWEGAVLAEEEMLGQPRWAHLWPLNPACLLWQQNPSCFQKTIKNTGRGTMWWAAEADTALVPTSRLLRIPQPRPLRSPGLSGEKARQPPAPRSSIWSFSPVSSNSTFQPLCLRGVFADRTELLVANTLFIVIECLVITLYIFSILKLKPFTSRNRC